MALNSNEKQKLVELVEKLNIELRFQEEETVMFLSVYDPLHREWTPYKFSITTETLPKMTWEDDVLVFYANKLLSVIEASYDVYNLKPLKEA